MSKKHNLSNFRKIIMNETTKNIFIEEMEAVLFRIEALPVDDPLLQEISAVTEPGNLRAVFLNMKFFLETGTVPKSGGEYSSLPAVIFGLPSLREFLAKEFTGRISAEDVQEMSASYLRLRENIS